jgi:hypothetical protein
MALMRGRVLDIQAENLDEVRHNHVDHITLSSTCSEM